MAPSGLRILLEFTTIAKQMKNSKFLESKMRNFESYECTIYLIKIEYFIKNACKNEHYNSMMFNNSNQRYIIRLIRKEKIDSNKITMTNNKLFSTSNKFF